MDPVLREGLVSSLCGNLSGNLGMKGSWVRASYTSALCQAQGQKAFPDRDRSLAICLRSGSSGGIGETGRVSGIGGFSM